MSNVYGKGDTTGSFGKQHPSLQLQTSLAPRHEVPTGAITGATHNFDISPVVTHPDNSPQMPGSRLLPDQLGYNDERAGLEALGLVSFVGSDSVEGMEGAFRGSQLDGTERSAMADPRNRMAVAIDHKSPTPDPETTSMDNVALLQEKMGT